MLIFQLLTLLSIAQHTESFAGHLSSNNTSSENVRQIQIERTGDRRAEASVTTIATGSAEISTSISVSATSQEATSSQILNETITETASQEQVEANLSEIKAKIAAQRQDFLQKTEAAKDKQKQKEAELQQRLTDIFAN